MQKRVNEILREIKKLESSPDKNATLPQNTFYLENERILALPRKYGESRFPYDADGFVVWAYQNGYITACDSTFTVFRSSNYGEDPVVAFFGGVEKDGGFFPISITGAARQLIEPGDIKRYTVFSLRCVYYITDTDDFTFAVKMSVSPNKNIRFSVTCENKSEGTRKIYVASFIEALLRFTESEGFWERMSKFGKLCGDGSYILWSRNGSEDCLVVNTKVTRGNLKKRYSTVGRSVFLGYKGRTLANAESLRTGSFDKYVNFANTTDLPVSSDIMHFELDGGDSVRADWELTVCHGMEGALKVVGADFDALSFDAETDALENEDKSVFDNMKVRFNDWKGGGVVPEVFNKFIRNVQKQVSFCALGKNYAGPHIGIRDVFQQLEGSLMWDPERSREKILVAMNYIMSNGRAPRQFSMPKAENDVPEFDLRMYIDQGVWVISTIYTYICHTGDFSILDEECGYYELYGEGESLVRRSGERDSVLCHLIRITDFLISKTDEKTGCMRALYGDWNDALDGLGRTSDEGKEFGDGVSVMTSLQFYQNLGEMDDIIRHTGKFTEKLGLYADVREKLKDGLFKYAVDTDENSHHRIIHGWGDKMAYKVGSLSDFDKKERYSLTANSFWAISGLMEKDISLKDCVTDCADAVDSKYGLKTFSRPFSIEDRPYIGRLATITEGTYENCCAYVHASMFGIMALFMVGESRRAWREMEKSIVITHENCTMTSFVMPNSYCENESLCIDGVSMGDWYTGSGTMLIKELIRFGIGLEPDLDGLYIQTPSYMPCSSCALSMKIKGKEIKFAYRNESRGEREYLVNGNKTGCAYSELMGTYRLYIPSEALSDGMTIEVVD